MSDRSDEVLDIVFGTVKFLFWAAVIGAIVFGYVSCVSNEQKQYKATHDTKSYVISGKVLQPPESLVRQVESSGGWIVGGGGLLAGSMHGAKTEGKGFVRLSVDSAKPANDLASPGEVIMLKTTDTKVIALTAGDQTSFVCNRQYESVDGTDSGVWEFDNCRMQGVALKPGG